MKKLLILGLLLFTAIGCSSSGHHADGHTHNDAKECCGSNGKCCK